MKTFTAVNAKKGFQFELNYLLTLWQRFVKVSKQYSTCYILLYLVLEKTGYISMLAYDHFSVIFNLRQFQVDRQQLKAHLVEKRVYMQ